MEKFYFKALVNAKFCKNPKLVIAYDFFLTGFNIAMNTSDRLGLKITPVTVNELPGLNTLGISMGRMDFGPYGLNPPHIHPSRYREPNRLEGYPICWLHNLQPRKSSHHPNSQNPGIITITVVVFGSKPSISDDVLAKAFQLDEKVVDNLQAKYRT
ncbi:putative germin-like protein 2-1 [Macadamia integrifolia]|uniref:putative germin-like protein 2-1 n=1 Tax=Macadamia integrifolia TaxID=60698 RepID=UPI001C4FCFC4|nr:putative germin-like protein 2-1 [Macadamia integrifolia]